MIPSILLPRFFKWIGLAFAAGGFIAGANYQQEPDNVLYPEGLLIQISILVGLLLFANARERIEDERIRLIRLTSLQWAVVLFMLIRVILKIVAFSKRDAEWLPHVEANVLLMIYLLLFYCQLYVPDLIAKLSKKDPA